MRRSLILPGLNILLIAGLAMGVVLPFPGVVSLTLAYIVLYIIPAWLLLRVLLPGAHIHPLSQTALALVAGIGAFSVPVMVGNFTAALDFSPALLIHAAWQAVAWIILVRRSASDNPAPARRLDGVTLVYATITVILVGIIIASFAHFDLHDTISLGGNDKSALSNFIDWFYHHPTQPYQPSTRNQGLVVRMQESGWLYRQALTARISGLAPHQLMFSHSTGPLLAFSFMAMFALAYAVTKRAAIAWLSVLFTAASYFVDYFARGPYIIGHPGLGAQVMHAIAEDKFVNGFVFVPAALALTLHLLNAGKRQHPASWLLWVLAMVTVFSTHPHGFGLYLLIMGSYALVTLLAAPPDWRKLLGSLKHRQQWLPALFALGLGAAVAVVPLYQVLGSRHITGLFDWDSPNKFEFGGIIDIGADGLYILHPGLVSAWIFALSIGIGLLMASRLRYDRAARYIFAATAGPLVVGYTPYLTAALGNIIRSHNLVRLVWLLPVGLALAYACWLALDWLRTHSRTAARAFPALAMIPLVAGAAITWGNYQDVTLVVFDRSSRPDWPEYSSAPLEELTEALAPITTRKTHVLAPAEANTYLFTVTSDIFVYNFRAGYLELYALYQNPWWGEDAHGMFEAFRPALWVVEQGSAQHTDARLRAYALVYQNGRYAVYCVPETLPPRTRTDRAHSLIARRGETLVDFFVEEDEAYAEPADWEDIAALYKDGSSTE